MSWLKEGHVIAAKLVVLLLIALVTFSVLGITGWLEIKLTALMFLVLVLLWLVDRD